MGVDGIQGTASHPLNMAMDGQRRRQPGFAKALQGVAGTQAAASGELAQAAGLALATTTTAKPAKAWKAKPLIAPTLSPPLSASNWTLLMVR